MFLPNKVKESENLVTATTESTRAEARKLREELESSSWLLVDTHDDLQLQRTLAEQRREEAGALTHQLSVVREGGNKALEDIRAQLMANHEKE